MEIEGEVISAVEVNRGAPCDATWEAAERIVGCTVEEAATRFGLEVQLLCVADGSGWDPIYGQSPIHFAAHVHRDAFERALDKAGRIADRGRDAAKTRDDPEWEGERERPLAPEESVEGNEELTEAKDSEEPLRDEESR